MNRKDIITYSLLFILWISPIFWPDSWWEMYDKVFPSNLMSFNTTFQQTAVAKAAIVRRNKIKAEKTRINFLIYQIEKEWQYIQRKRLMEGYYDRLYRKIERRFKSSL